MINTTPFMTVYCQTCKKIVIFTSEPDRARQYARNHHKTHPGHWITASIRDPITNKEHRIDIPNRDIQPEDAA